MKKILLITIIVLLIILLAVSTFKGVQIGKLKILSLSEIKQQNDNLDEKIQQATKVASTDYEQKINELNEEIKKLEKEKSQYEDMVNVSTESEVEAANQTYDYKIDFLWVRIENHAKSEGVNMKMELTRSSSGDTNLYNLSFTVTGSYVGISEFITDIEDDSKLGFKIEEFKMNSISSENNTSTVQATFTCKDITVEGISSNSSTSTSTQTKNSNTSTNNTSDTTNTTDTTKLKTSYGALCCTTFIRIRTLNLFQCFKTFPHSW